MYCVHLYSLHVYFALVDLDSSGLRCPSHTWSHIKYPSSLCVCTRVYKHTHTHHPNTRKIEKYTRQNSYLQPRQNIVSHASNKRKPCTNLNQPHFQSPHTHAYKCSEIPGIHWYVVERLDSANKQNAPTRVHMYTNTRAYINVYAYIYIDLHIHIYIYILIHMHYTRIHAHTYTYAYICTRMHR